MVWESKLVYFVCVAFGLWVLERVLMRYRNGARQSLQAVSWLAEFALAGLGFGLLFHLVYFAKEYRFFLPMGMLVVVMSGGMVGGWLRRLPRMVLAGVLVLVFLGAVYMRVDKNYPPPYRWLAAEGILRDTPENAWIISGIEPAYLEYLVAKDSLRHIVPISRNVEYAGKLIAPERIPQPQPPPESWQDHRCPGLLHGGAHEAVRFVAAEQFAALAGQLERGTRIYVDMAYLAPEDLPILQELMRRFVFVPRSEILYELRQRR